MRLHAGVLFVSTAISFGGLVASGSFLFANQAPETVRNRKETVTLAAVKATESAVVTPEAKETEPVATETAQVTASTLVLEEDLSKDFDDINEASSTPTPTPAPPPLPPPPPPMATPSEIDEWFRKYSGEYRVGEDILRKIAVCESGYNSLATNGIYVGMFQFSPGAWTSARSRMGQNTDLGLRLNAEESIKTAAFKISVDGTGAWPNCD